MCFLAKVVVLFNHYIINSSFLLFFLLSASVPFLYFHHNSYDIYNSINVLFIYASSAASIGPDGSS